MDKQSDGQKQFLKIISQIIALDKISHAYLIETSDSLADTSVIKAFIKIILCQSADKKLDKINCNKCNICNLVDNDTYPDIKIIECDGQWIKKEQLIELRKEYQNSSLLDNKRIYIIRDAEKLNQAAANTILKFLEEPADNIVAILLTSNRYKVLETIVSRCQVLTIAKPLEIDVALEDVLLLKYITNKKDLFIRYKDIIDTLLTDKNSAYLKLKKIEDIYIGYLNGKITNKKIVSDDIVNILSSKTDNEIIQNILIIEEEFNKMDYNINYKLWLDNLFARFMEVI
jgi:DNA polymerase III gamma/tau subunit